MFARSVRAPPFVNARGSTPRNRQVVVMLPLPTPSAAERVRVLSFKPMDHRVQIGSAGNSLSRASRFAVLCGMRRCSDCSSRRTISYSSWRIGTDPASIAAPAHNSPRHVSRTFVNAAGVSPIENGAPITRMCLVWPSARWCGRPGRAYRFVEGRPESVWSRPPPVEPPPGCASCRHGANARPEGDLSSSCTAQPIEAVTESTSICGGGQRCPCYGRAVEARILF
jgi:hypothetical protein